MTRHLNALKSNIVVSRFQISSFEIFLTLEYNSNNKGTVGIWLKLLTTLKDSQPNLKLELSTPKASLKYSKLC